MPRTQRFFTAFHFPPRKVIHIGGDGRLRGALPPMMNNFGDRIMDTLRTDTTLATILPLVNINIVNGTVALQGTVQNERQRQAIGEAVQRGAGAQNVVDNQLRISP